MRTQLLRAVMETLNWTPYDVYPNSVQSRTRDGFEVRVIPEINPEDVRVEVESPEKAVSVSGYLYIPRGENLHFRKAASNKIQELLATARFKYNLQNQTQNLIVSIKELQV